MTPLIQYALKGLQHCYLPDKQCWSYIYHLDGRTTPNESIPAKDCFYTLNVILGLASCEKGCWENQYDLPKLLHHNASQLTTLPVPTYALGMALWAAAGLREPLQHKPLDHIYSIIQNQRHWHSWSAQDAGMVLSGLCAQKQYGTQGNDGLAELLFFFIRTHFIATSGLFRNNSCGIRKNFASFASQCYLIAACYHYGQQYNSTEALQIADRTTRIMLGLQGGQGEWPWFYFAPTAHVIDPYEIYSVHQVGMAPLFLHPAIERHIEGAANALHKGFAWVLGENQLHSSMLAPEYGMFYRSMARKAELKTKYRRMLRSASTALLGRPVDLLPSDSVTIRKECRSYELGWLLYAFGNRPDMPDITHHPAFNGQY